MVSNSLLFPIPHPDVGPLTKTFHVCAQPNNSCKNPCSHFWLFITLMVFEVPEKESSFGSSGCENGWVGGRPSSMSCLGWMMCCKMDGCRVLLSISSDDNVGYSLYVHVLLYPAYLQTVAP
jgi:hypothetical protein